MYRFILSRQPTRIRRQAIIALTTEESMRIGRQAILVVWVISILAGCVSRGVTSLADGFKSYDSIAVIRERLNQAGLAGRWQEQQKSTASSDRRPPYQFLTMSGPYSLLGFDGALELVFYNE